MINDIWIKQRGPQGFQGPTGPAWDGETPLSELTVTDVARFSGTEIDMYQPLTIEAPSTNTKTASMTLKSKLNGVWVAGDIKGEINFYGSDVSGSGAGNHAWIKAAATDTFGVATDLIFGTSDAGGEAVERFKINKAGSFFFNDKAYFSPTVIEMYKPTSINTAGSTVLELNRTTTSATHIKSGSSQGGHLVLDSYDASGSTLLNYYSEGNVFAVSNGGAFIIGSTSDNGVDLLQVGANTDISTSIGRGRMGLASGGITDTFYMSHYDTFNSTDYSLYFTRFGDTVVNAASSRAIYFRNSNNNLVKITGSAIEIYQPVDISEEATFSKISANNPTHRIGNGTDTQAVGTKFGTRYQAKDATGTKRYFDIAFDPNDASYGFGYGVSGSDLPINAGMGFCDILVESDNIKMNHPVNINNATIGTHQLAVNGTSANTTGVWAVLSDERVKENIREVSTPLDKAIALADCVRQYNYVEEAEMVGGLRTQYLAQKLIANGFEGHVSETEPKNEAVGVLLGWEYGDEEYTVEEPITKTVTVEETQIIEVESGEYTTETVTETQIVDGGELEVISEVSTPIMTTQEIVVEVEKEIETTETVTKTRRAVLVEGDKLLQVENNFAPYAFPAIKELNDKVVTLEARIAQLEMLLITE